jgi:hypothetical protein
MFWLKKPHIRYTSPIYWKVTLRIWFEKFVFESELPLEEPDSSIYKTYKIAMKESIPNNDCLFQFLMKNINYDNGINIQPLGPRYKHLIKELTSSNLIDYYIDFDDNEMFKIVFVIPPMDKSLKEYEHELDEKQKQLYIHDYSNGILIIPCKCNPEFEIGHFQYKSSIEEVINYVNEDNLCKSLPHY